MAKLTITERVKNTLKEIAFLEDRSFEEILAALQTIPLLMNDTALSASLSPLIKSVSRVKVDELSATLFAIHMGYANSEVSLEAFITDVLAALTSVNDG